MNHIKELKIHVEALKKIVDQDPNFFMAILIYVEKLNNLLSRASTSFDLNESSVYINKIKEFFNLYRTNGSDPDIPYIQPDQIINTESIVLKITGIYEELRIMEPDQLQNIILDLDENYLEMKSKAEDAIEMLSAQTDKLKKLIESLRSKGRIKRNYEGFYRWRDITAKLISNGISPAEGSKFLKTLMYQHHQDLYDDICIRANIARSFFEGLEEEIRSHPDEIFDLSEKEDLVSSRKESPRKTFSKKIFVVHGHDHETKNELEIFLKEIGLEPIVLHRKPDEGRTIIEKFEEYSDVGFAIIILTPDDVFYTFNEDKKDFELSEKRARQNVIFEWGFFVGKLGRHRVCCLHKKSVDLPSDIHGVLYKPFEKSLDEIKFPLVKELKAAGYEVEL